MKVWIQLKSFPLLEFKLVGVNRWPFRKDVSYNIHPSKTELTVELNFECEGSVHIVSGQYVTQISRPYFLKTVDKIVFVLL